MTRIPNATSPVEIRKAFQQVKQSAGVLSEGASGEILIGAGANVTPIWSTDLTALTFLTVDNITIDGAIISSDTGAISFSNENLTTTGTIAGINVTSGENPGHTHTGASLSGIDISDDTNLVATSPIVLTDDTLSLNQGSINHGLLNGLGDDDHTIYLLAGGTRALTGNMSVDAGITIDGRDISVDGTKLDTIETNADVTDATNVAAAGAAMSGGAFHDGFSDFVANEHIDWTNATDAFLTTSTQTTGVQVGNFLFCQSGSTAQRLGHQNQATGNVAMYDFYTKDGDSTDDVGLVVFGKGTPNDWTGWEVLEFRWDASESEFAMDTLSGGSGVTNRPLNIYTPNRSGQVYLDTNGRVGINEKNPATELDVNGFITADNLVLGNFRFRSSGGVGYRLGMICELASYPAMYDFYTGDGDGTDDIGLVVFGKGTPTDWTPYEILEFKWDASESEFTFNTLSGGGGTNRPLNIFTPGNAHQVFLKEDGNTGICNSNPTSTLDITGTFAVSGNCIFSGTGHDNFTDFVANEHIDHTGVTLTAGSGLAGGGTIAANRIFDLDINSLAVATIESGDFVPFWDITATATNKKTTFANFEAALTHDNFIAGTIANHDTTATGANLTSLTDDSMVDALHRHSELSASDGTPDQILIIDASGYVGIGDPNPPARLSVSGTDFVTSSIYFTRYSNNINPPAVNMRKSRGATIGDIAIVEIGDDLGILDYRGDDGTDLVTTGARIKATVTNTPSLNTMPAELTFWTHPASGGSVLQRMTITDNGDIGVNAVAPDARFEVSTETDEGKQAITIDQNDEDQAFIDFQGATEASAAKSISSWTAGASIEGFIWVEINGVKKRMAYYDEPTS